MSTAGSMDHDQSPAGSASHTEHGRGLPGFTAAGLGSANQLLALTGSVSFTFDRTTGSHELFVLPAAVVGVGGAPMPVPLTSDGYPVLAQIWDNEEDDIFDSI